MKKIIDQLTDENNQINLEKLISVIVSEGSNLNFLKLEEMIKGTKV